MITEKTYHPGKNINKHVEKKWETSDGERKTRSFLSSLSCFAMACLVVFGECDHFSPLRLALPEAAKRNYRERKSKTLTSTVGEAGGCRGGLWSRLGGGLEDHPSTWIGGE